MFDLQLYHTELFALVMEGIGVIYEHFLILDQPPGSAIMYVKELWNHVGYRKGHENPP